MKQAISAHLSSGYREVGPSIELTPEEGARGTRGSALLVDEYFASGDARLVDEVLRFDGMDKLGALGERWYADRRPFARAALLELIDDGCDRPGHKALVKRVFKAAEKAGDDETMAHFLVAFDRLSRRTVAVVRYEWNGDTRTAEPRQGLVNELLVPSRLPENAKSDRFTLATRRYLARRAFRYFRRLGFADVARYRRAMLTALPLYRDEHLDKPERLLDAWGLMHALYGRSPVLDKAPRGLRVAEGRSLASLGVAPYFADAWRGCETELFALVESAKSRTVRSWAIAWLQGEYAASLHAMPIARVRPLLASPHEEVQRFGAALLETATGLESLPIDAWLAMLGTTSLDAVLVVCAAVKKHVAPSRLSLGQCVDLACAKVAPVADLGLAWGREKPVKTDADLTAILRVSGAGVVSVREAGVAWCASLLRSLEGAKTERARDLCDARFADARAAGLAVVADVPRFREDLGLWLALGESPYPDVRAFLVAHAKEWRDRADQASLAHVWTSALVAIHGPGRGGDVKRDVLRMIADRVAAHPDEADALLPLLGLALRSVRAPERAFGLAAIARAAVTLPALRDAAARHLPELTLGAAVTT
jgi:hypothetical protein